MESSVIYTPLHDNTFLKFFFWKGTLLLLEIVNIPVERFLQKDFTHAKLWICFFISVYIQHLNSLFCWFLDRCHKVSENLDVMGKMAFIHVFSRRKANWVLKICSWDFFAGLCHTTKLGVSLSFTFKIRKWRPLMLKKSKRTRMLGQNNYLCQSQSQNVYLANIKHHTFRYQWTL